MTTFRKPTIGKNLLRVFRAAIAMILLSSLGSKAETAMPPINDIGSTCFSRVYSAAHLRKNTLQMIGRIVLTSVERRGQQVTLPAGSFEMLLGVQQRGSKVWYHGFAQCRFQSNGYTCQVEGDGGGFSVLDRADGTVRLSTKGSIRMEGSQDSIEFGGRFSDDNIFSMNPAACRRHANGQN